MWTRILICFSLLGLSSILMAEHLDPYQLMSLAPNPDVRASYDPTTRTYQRGGIGILVYDGANAIDALGPFQVFSTAGLKPLLISASKNSNGLYKKNIVFNSDLEITAHRTIADTNDLEVLIVPGGALDTINLAKDSEVINWIKTIDQKTVATGSVCTGSWILGAAGLLQGKQATSNWYRADELLRHFGAIPQPKQRYLYDGKIWTASGVTAGIDMALAMVQKVFTKDLNDGKDYTQSVMLDLQYDPKPPIVGGSPENTEPSVFDAMQSMYDLFNLNNLVKEIPVQ